MSKLAKLSSKNVSKKSSKLAQKVCSAALSIPNPDELLANEITNIALGLTPKRCLGDDIVSNALICDTDEALGAAVINRMDMIVMTPEAKQAKSVLKRAMCMKTPEQQMAHKIATMALSMKTPDQVQSAEVVQRALAFGEPVTPTRSEKACATSILKKVLAMPSEDELLAVDVLDQAFELAQKSEEANITSQQIVEAALKLDATAILANEVLATALGYKTQDEKSGELIVKRALALLPPNPDAATAKLVLQKALKMPHPDVELAALIVDKALAEPKKVESTLAKTAVQRALELRTPDELLAVDVVGRAVEISSEHEATSVSAAAVVEAALKLDAETIAANDVLLKALGFKSEDDKIAESIFSRAMSLMPTNPDARLAQEVLHKALRSQNPDAHISRSVMKKALELPATSPYKARQSKTASTVLQVALNMDSTDVAEAVVNKALNLSATPQKSATVQPTSEQRRTIFGKIAAWREPTANSTTITVTPVKSATEEKFERLMEEELKFQKQCAALPSPVVENIVHLTPDKTYSLNHAWKHNPFFSKAVEHSIEKALRPSVRAVVNKTKPAVAKAPRVSAKHTPRSSVSSQTSRNLFAEPSALPASLPAPRDNSNVNTRSTKAPSVSSRRSA